MEIIPLGDPTETTFARVFDNRLPDVGSPTPDLEVPTLEKSRPFGVSFRAALLLNNTLADPLWNLYYDATHGAEPEQFDPNFNPYTYLRTHLDKDIYDGLRPEISAGLFEDAITPYQVDFKVASLLREKRLIGDEQGNWLGALAGAVTGSLLDPASYLIPGGGWWKTGPLAIRIGKAMFHSALSMAPQEAILWSEQDLRTWQQSLMNVGGAAILGGGLAMFGRAHLPGHAINPENEANPLKPENLTRQGVVTRVPGAGEDDIHWQPSTVGAAETPIEAPSRLGDQTAVGKAILGVTPAGRTLGYESPVARDLLTRLMDLGGVYTDTNRFGVRTAPSAEDLKLDYENRWLGQTLIKGDDLIAQTSQGLGDIGAPRLDPADFNDLTGKLLRGTVTPDDRAVLERTYGVEGARRIFAGAEQYAADIEAVHAEMGGRLKELGYIRDDTKVEALQRELEAARTERASALAAHDAETARLREQAAAEADTATDPRIKAAIQSRLKETLVVQDARRRELTESFDNTPIRRELERQLGLPAPLGKEYGHAQLWEPDTIAADQGSFRNFLHRVLIDKPDENWLLDAHGLTTGDFERLKTTDPEQVTALLREWAGDEHHWRVTRLENAFEAAQQRAKRATLDLNDTLRRLGVLRHDETQAKLSERGRFRDLIQKRMETARAERDALDKEQRALIEPRQIGRRLSETNRRLTRLERQLDVMETAWEEARDAAARVTSARQALDAERSLIRHADELAGRNVGQLERSIKTARRAIPLDDAIDEIVANLMDRGRVPISAMESIVPESGRMKARRIILNRSQKIEAERAGWLRTDLPNILETEVRQLAGHIGLREALDIGHDRTFESWADIERRFNADYDRLKAANPERAANLEAERQKALRDLRGLKDRLLHQIDPGADRDSWLLWLQRRMRDYNFIRYGSTMLASAIPDLGALALQHRVIPMLAQHGKEAFEQFRKLPGNTDFKAFLSASEIATHGSLLSRRMDDAGLAPRFGIGTPGTLKRTVTTAADRAFTGLSELVGKISLLSQWDRYWKILAGMQMAHDLREQVSRYASLSELERTHLASLGIGGAEAERLARYFSEYGATDEHGIWDPNLSAWLGTRDGQEAARDFRVAIRRDIDRARFWPGIGDRPLFMDKWWGQLLGQFQTFAYTFLNRYMTPLMQRAVHFRDLRAAASFATLMLSGAITLALKDALHYQDPTARWQPQDPSDYLRTGMDLMDRSGLTGYLGPYVDAAVKLAGIAGTSRFQHETWAEDLLGVNAALISDATRFGSAVTSGENGERVTKKAIALAPFSGLLNLGYHVYNDR